MTIAEASTTWLDTQLFGAAGAIAPDFAGTTVVTMLEAGEGISDLVFSVGRPAQVEKHGELTGVDIPGCSLLTMEHTAQIARQLIGANDAVLRSLKDQGACDFSYSIPNCARFRV